jgi:phospholipid/cholesterol/gamma-HCH transport system ATP-binding protein
MRHSLIKIEGLSKSFIKNNIFSNINLSVNEGQILTIIGGSGQGKSVLLKCIIGLIDADEGQVFYDGAVLTQKNKFEFIRNFGVLFQGAALFDSMPVWENISFQFKYSGLLSNNERLELAKRKLDLVGLPEATAYLFPSELSGGMQKRVGIARAIAANPKVLFFDEPTSGLDPIMSNTVNKLIRSLVKELGTTAITISHDLNSIRLISDIIALLHQGHIDFVGTIDDFEATKNKNIKRFIKPNSIK